MQLIKQKLLLQKELKKLDGENPSKEMIDRIGAIQSRLDRLNENYEALATQIPKEKFPAPHRQTEWLEELQNITRPILNSLREFTERPRRIDNLKAEIETLTSRISTYEIARKNILSLETLQINASDVSDLIEKEKRNLISISEIKQKYKDDLSTLKDRYNPEMLKLELEEAQRSLMNLKDVDGDLVSVVASSLSEFMSVRGRNLIIAFVLLVGVFWALLFAYSVVETRTQFLNKIKRSTRKFIKTIYLLVIFLIAFSASLFSLYLVNDWLLLSLLLLILAAIGWTSRQFIPRFIQELKLTLNLSSVREGERIFYEGIPWLVKEIGLHAKLHNPRLDGGMIRVPVNKLIGLSSRQFVKEEDWFPCKVGDWILVDESIFGQVASQTPEQVILKYYESRKTYLTPEFLTLKPRNLSSGFMVGVTFGLDYAVQDRICEELPDLFHSHLKETFKDMLESQPPAMKYLKVQFSQASASSLDLFILAEFSGALADRHYSLKREINNALVDACNKHNLTIPFTQMTVSLAPDAQSAFTKE
ncbi:MAG: hypothetical protein G3M78_08320 [Candidatus Nitrohelix vancouverensis]|uniref:Mechanosensitive ion channel n=1 Tax=Candidatus Nitrohelix vancouverensis TaxID=2705534 RepID=A0A7T0C2M7_9BACT|nr:MAG: hypothetical protein G3M78_08320 [Candidatus Nitrohelix vancouverensis]